MDNSFKRKTSRLESFEKTFKKLKIPASTFDSSEVLDLSKRSCENELENAMLELAGISAGPPSLTTLPNLPSLHALQSDASEDELKLLKFLEAQQPKSKNVFGNIFRALHFFS